MSSPNARSTDPQRGPASSAERSAAPPAPSSEALHAPLRLTVTRGVLGIELYEPVEIGPLEVAHLALSLPGLRFPLDLSGGVRVFRHRRGELTTMRLVVRLDYLARWLSGRLRDVIGPLERSASIWPIEGGVGVGLSGHGCALAFDLLWVPVETDARWVVSRARGVGLEGAALGYALRAIDSVFGRLGQRRGRLLVFPHAGLSLSRAVLPALGARAPRAASVRFGEVALEHDQMTLTLDESFVPPAVGRDGARALELAELVAPADDDLAAGKLDAARQAYLAALEQAPRHPDIVRTVAELDVRIPGRAEAALGLLVESIAATHAGSVGGELLAGVGDQDGARDAFASAASSEPYAPLSALLWKRLGELEVSGAARIEALDEAVARSPSLASARWARFDARLERGDVEGATADAEHLEAAAEGSRERHAVCRRAARRFLDEAYVRDAGRMFERALRYLPDDAAATAGLARSLLQLGKTDRAVALLERAISLGEAAGEAPADALIDLARILAGELRDLPQAIARVRQVRPSAHQVIEARGLEGRWRAGLGDIAGATLAFGRLRDAIEMAVEPDRREAAQWLAEAAKFEREVQNDALAAERHLAVAVRIAPRDRRVAEAYREAAAVVAARSRRDREGDRRDTTPPSVAPPVRSREDDEALVEQLRARLVSRPGDDKAALQLAGVLERLERSEELFALLSARLEEADDTTRSEIVVRLRRVLESLATAAEAAGNLTESEIYRERLATL